MDNITSWNNFFHGSHKTTGIAGLTLADPVDPTSTVFYTFNKQNGSVGNNLLLASTTDHELGHQLDEIWGEPSQNADTWIFAQSNDFNKTEPGYINGENCSTVFTVATCVDPKYFDQKGELPTL